jgi:hypothetical protein
MDQSQGHGVLFDLFESSGIALVGLDGDNRILHANPNLGTYLDLDPAALVGKDARALAPALRSAEFWASFPGTFYCLAPGPHSLMLTISRPLRSPGGGGLARAIILRPYSLEREFGRMRVCLNNYLAHEIASHLNSVGIASEFITEPELRESRQTREAFITTFRHDLSDLNTLFVQLLETGEPLVLPSRVARARLDWKALCEDLTAKIRGLANERSVSLSCSLAPHLAGPEGDYHWLYLGLFGVLAHALRSAPALSEVTVACQRAGGGIQTQVALRCGEDDALAPWPPPALFPLDEGNPRIGRLEISDLAVTRTIFLLHGGELLRERSGDRVVYTVVLPA